MHRVTPRRAKWSQVIGPGILFTFVVQLVTGLILAFSYSPSATDAWPSVYFIQEHVTLGWFVRGLHHFGTSVLIVLLVLQLVQSFVQGAYRAPREINWITGVLLLFVVLGAAITGNALPWDQTGYWAAKTEVTIAGGMPLVGPGLQTLAQGGPEFGNLTLTRFYTLHTLILPAVIVTLFLLQYRMLARHGHFDDVDATSNSQGKVQSIQALMNAAFALLILAVLSVLIVVVGTPLDAPADPASDFVVRPEWYFLFLYKLVRLFEGPMVLLGTVGLPGLAATFLILLPFLDRGPDTKLKARKLWSILFFGMLVAVFGLTAATVLSDQGDETFQTLRVEQDRNAKEAVHYAGNEDWGINALGHVVLYRGKAIFRREKCTECHIVSGEGTGKAPKLDGFLSRQWIRQFLVNPNSANYFGLTKLKYDDDAGTGMPSQAELGDETLDQITEFLLTLSGEDYEPPIDLEMAKAGRTHFDEGDCSSCHALDDEEGDGPSLKDYGSRAWIKGLLKAPSSPLYYGELGDDMPPFDHLSEPELEYVTTWLLNLKNEQ